MFAFRVKHLLVACVLSIVFLYFSSIQEPSKVPARVTSQGRNEDAVASWNDSTLDDESDAIERFIDKYINEATEVFAVDENAVTTEETLVYYYLEDTGASGNESDENGNRTNVDIPKQAVDVYGDDEDEMLNSLADTSHTEDISNYNLHNSPDLRVVDSEKVVTDNHEAIGPKHLSKKSFTSKEKHKKSSTSKEKHKKFLTSKEKHKKIFPPKDKHKSFSKDKHKRVFPPKDKQKGTNPPDNAIKTDQNPNKIDESGDLEQSKPPSRTASDQKPLPVGPAINKEQQKKTEKDSPIVVLRRDKYWPPVLQPSDAKIFSMINYTKYAPEDRAYLLGRVGMYEERAKVVGEVCRNNPQLIGVTPTHTFVWDQRHNPNIVWCEISKVASTSWMVNFLRLGHYRENDTSLSHLSQEERDAIRFETQLEDDNLHFRVLRLFPAPNTTLERSQVFSKALRFIIVRHPFSRLLSAYQDKMITLNPVPKIFNFRQLQMDIIQRYRDNKQANNKQANNTQISDSQFPTFGEFVQYVIDSTAGLKTVKDWRKVVCWVPYWAKCGVCAHDFQMIIKLETMRDDEHFLVTLAGLQELDKVFEWRHSVQTTFPKEEFFRQLSTDQMHQLHQRYLLDFQLFGYSIHQYLELAYDAPKHTR